MNIRKNVDYSAMFDAMQVAMSADMSQMKLYYELGRFICQRTEKGAAVAAAEYLQQNYPGVSGLSPRNLRRMRNFYHMYEGNPELLDLAMQIGWTQNVVILEADLNTEERRWYLCAVRRWGWSKAELQQKIESHAHQEVHLTEPERQCYIECEPQELDHTKYDQGALPPPKLYLHNSKSQVYHEQFGKEPPGWSNGVASNWTVGIKKIGDSIYPSARCKLPKHGINCPGKTTLQHTYGYHRGLMR